MLIPHLLLGRHGQLGLGPLAGDVDAEARNHGRRVPQAHGCQMQAAKKGEENVIEQRCQRTLDNLKFLIYKEHFPYEITIELR